MTETSTTAAPRASAYVPPNMKNVIRRSILRETYRSRMEMAGDAAATGHGYEDLVAMFNISERDARQIVFGKFP